MSSDQNQPNDRSDQDLPPDNQPGDPVEDAVSSVFDPLARQIVESDQDETVVTQEPGETLAEPDPALPPERPGASTTTGTGTSIAVGCVAVCAVILLITILILTIVS